MILSICLILAVAIWNVSPWVLLGLGITWIPDVILMALLFGGRP